MSDTVLKPGQQIKPKIDEKAAIALVEELYGFHVKKINELNAYDDKNYHVLCDSENTNPHVSEIVEHGYVLKVLNSLDSRNVSFVEGQNEMMLFLNQRGVACPVPVKNLRGSFYAVKQLGCSANEGHVVSTFFRWTLMCLKNIYTFYKYVYYFVKKKRTVESQLQLFKQSIATFLRPRASLYRPLLHYTKLTCITYVICLYIFFSKLFQPINCIRIIVNSN